MARNAAKKTSKNHQILIIGFQCFSHKYRRLIKKNCTSYPVHNQIWLNLPMDDHHFFYMKTKFPKIDTARIRPTALNKYQSVCP